MGSASQPMLVVKANRALLRKRKSFKDIREAYNGQLNNSKLQFKELTPFEQKKIRDKIRRQARRDKLIEIQIYIISLFLVLVLSLGIYFLMT